ncbi:trimeric intracellular cation channel family protein [Sulfurimonas lithotrophica]|uniref:Trimeric intracellular cation channel family protein n=1 Tax=Sulfurimonas lithotrophica TaxID=2590022 RepID=A0A5P8P248_9BACT|nr:TRIC cation channel family protein [Sulfurimonas lithotrophica]QFR49813.1 trimeric intracellular cation channel family protein [Sulfurimonas lithotrophica]
MFEVAEYIGIVAFAMSGFFVATRAKLDLLGILISTFLTALGGGIIRDISVDTTPFTFSHNYPGIMVLSVMILMILFKFHKRNSFENKSYFILSDSIGLISFSISGAIIAIEHNLNFTGVLAISFITAVGGGIVRDVILNEVPFVFKTGFYGTVALLMAICVYVLNIFDFINIVTLSLLFILGVVLRLIAFYKKWSIPLK